jgi:hypothetical protein
MFYNAEGGFVARLDEYCNLPRDAATRQRVV